MLEVFTCSCGGQNWVILSLHNILCAQCHHEYHLPPNVLTAKDFNTLVKFIEEQNIKDKQLGQ